jgi:hypothetical protein
MQYVYQLISFMFGGVEVTQIVWPPIDLLIIAIVLAVVLKYITWRIDNWVAKRYGDYYTLYRYLRRQGTPHKDVKQP